MNFRKKLLACSLLFIVLAAFQTQAQKITYSTPEKNEAKQTEFEIIGKYNGNFLVYKNNRNNSYISVYDNDLQLKENVSLSAITERLINSDVIAYPEFSYLFYQYQKRNIVYCMLLKLGPDGKPLTQPIELDTTQVGMSSGDRVYSIIASEDKQKILVFKVNSRDEKKYLFKTLLYSKDMTPLHSGRTELKMNDRNDFLSDFNLDNDGNLVFGRGIRPGSSDNINRFYLVVKPALADTFSFNELKLENISLDEVKLRMDNYNNRYLFTGFYYKGKRGGSIEGISNAIFDKTNKQWVIKNVIPLGQELREDAKGDNNLKSAFDDYYIQQIIIKKDGGFVVVAESNYQTSRGNTSGFNRWGNMYSPFISNFDYYRYGGYYPYGFNRWGSSGLTRYHADNVVVGAFDKEGKLVLSNTIRKSQYDDDNQALVSYQLVNNGNSLRFIYNDYEKRDVVLTYQSIDAEGKVTRPPTLKNLDKGFSFLPRYGKQVSSNTIIIPCLYRNLLCFAKLEF
ncbi:MAG: hypothetical protein V4717_04665 [Bacteroidota bacterium]